MKRFYLVAALAATAMAAAFFTSCDKQEEVRPPQPESAALGFQSVVTAGLETRAAGDPTPLNASFKINLDTNDAYSTAVNNQEVKYTDGSGYSISPAIYLLKSSRNMVAWAPVGVEPDAEAAPNVFTLNPGNTTAAVDFVYQENTEVNSGKCTDLALTLKHAFAKLTFTLNATNYPFSAPSLSSLVVKGTPGVSTIDISNGSYSTVTDADLTVVSTATDFTSPNAVTALVLPKTAASLTLDCTLDGTSYQNIAVKDIAKLDACANYNITINITGTEISVSGVQVPDWTAGGNGSADLK